MTYRNSLCPYSFPPSFQVFFIPFSSILPSMVPSLFRFGIISRLYQVWSERFNKTH